MFGEKQKRNALSIARQIGEDICGKALKYLGSFYHSEPLAHLKLILEHDDCVHKWNSPFATNQAVHYSQVVAPVAVGASFRWPLSS